MTTSSTTTTPPSSVRYQSLLAGIDKVLTKSRESLDLAQVIQQGYGDDASVFGGDDALTGVMDGMLDRVHDKVTDDMVRFLETQSVEEQLIQVEKLVDNIVAIEKAQHAENEADKESAKACLEDAQLPEGVKPMDILNHRAFQLMLEEETKLAELVAQYEGETNELEAVVKEAEQKIEGEMKQVEEVGRELDRAADVCATLS
jgi:hypothetical protein